MRAGLRRERTGRGAGRKKEREGGREGGREAKTYQQLVESRVTSQDQGAVDHLNRALAQTDEVSTDTHTATSDVGESESLIVRAGGLPGNHPGATQVLHADAVHLREGRREGGREGGREGEFNLISVTDQHVSRPGIISDREKEGGRAGGREGRRTYLPNDILERPPLLALFGDDQVRIDGAGLEAFVLLRGEVEVLEPEGRVGGVIPGDAEFALQVVDEADTGT